jgi:Ala-tRNA(Pro) deacylase
LAPERELALCFPDCEAGAMPPLGNLWGLRVYADESLEANDRIAFNAGTHEELLEMPWSDFVGLAQPRIGRFADPIGASVPPLGSLASHAVTGRRERARGA